MSDVSSRRRIRAQGSAQDPQIMGFMLDAPVQPGRSSRFDAPDARAPLSGALFSVAGVRHAEVSDATIWVRKTDDAGWDDLKPAIAAAIRQVLDSTNSPLGAPTDVQHTDPDVILFGAVAALLERQVNPSVASHGGHIAVERVTDGDVHLRMSGGCQGCAASSATLRQGVERMLRAELPTIREIVDVTDHAVGRTPFYQHADRPSPILNRALPPGVIGWEGEQITVDPDYLAPRLGLSAEALRESLRTGDVVGVTEIGQGADAGTSRVILRSATRAWAAEVFTDGAAREIPPPRAMDAAAGREQDLAARVRAYLGGLPADSPGITYGALARALGCWAPGSVARITRALEATMRADAAAARPFIAARALSRGRDRLPGRGFFDLARVLGTGPREGETDRDFHSRELARLSRAQDSRRHEENTPASLPT